MTRRPPFLRGRAAGHEVPTDPERIQFQVVLGLARVEPCSEDELADTLQTAVETLVADATGIALGPAGSADVTTSTVELEFTVEAISPAVFYAKMGEVLRILERAGFEFERSTEERVAPSAPGLKLQPA